MKSLLFDYSSPSWVVALLTTVTLVLIFIGLPLARRAGRLRRKLSDPSNYATKQERNRDRALFLASFVPSLLVWLSVMAVSFKGLTGFAADYMGWNHWTNIMVPLSLDGISIAFGAHAFRSVKKGRYPGRAYRIVFASAAVSATLNFVHARDVWSLWAGIYLAFMSMVGVGMFHELLEQFNDSDDEQYLRSKSPRFGARWGLAPWSTWCAWRMWKVAPPRDNRPATINNALDNLDEARERKRLAKAAHRNRNADLERDLQRAAIQRSQELNDIRQRPNAGLPVTAAPLMTQQSADPRFAQGGLATGVADNTFSGFQPRPTAVPAQEPPAVNGYRPQPHTAPAQSPVPVTGVQQQPQPLAPATVVVQPRGTHDDDPAPKPSQESDEETSQNIVDVETAVRTWIAEQIKAGNGRPSANDIVEYAGKLGSVFKETWAKKQRQLVEQALSQEPAEAEPAREFANA